MKKLLSILVATFLIATLAHTQIIISEIMYNPPEGGMDSLEYVEIYNSSDQAMQLNGYSFVLGIEHTFGDTMMEAGSFFVLSGNPEALKNVTGVESTLWDSGILKNDGEALRLLDPNGGIDTVSFEVISPWPNLTDGAAGGGASIEFCLDADDNAIGENWRASSAGNGVVINQVEFKGTPGTANSAMCSTTAATTITVTSNVFTPGDITVNVGDKVLWKNEMGFHNVNGSTETYPNNPEGFGNGGAASAPWEYEFTFTEEGIYDYQCDPHVSLGMTGTVTVVNDLPSLVITEIMYNDPSPDEIDSLEFIEVYNAGSADVFLGGMVLKSSVINFTLPDSTLAAGEFLILQKQFSGFINDLGLLTIPFTNGGLGNNSDSVTLLSAEGAEIDQVVYMDSGDWPVAADGLGSSISLCNIFSDNSVAANWQASSTQTDREYEAGMFLFANPGALNICGSTIADATQVDENGELLNLGESVSLEGTVYGVNLRPGGLQFTIIDNTNNGIVVFSASDNFGYAVVEGDGVKVSGEMDQFNGLAQIRIDSLELLSMNNTLIEADTVLILGEETESSLVTFKNAFIVDPSEWNGSGSGFNVDVTNGTDTIEIRIDNDVLELFNGAYPSGTFTVTGLGGQFDNSAPFLDGYQLLPRYVADIAPYVPFEEEYPVKEISEVTIVDENGVAISDGDKVEITGTTHGINFRDNGLQFTIIDDSNNGIGLFAGSNSFGYEYAEGDIVTIKGSIDQFNGLTQISPDSLTLVSSANGLQEPSVVTNLGEETESQYVRIETATVLDPTQWAGDGSTFNVDVITSSGNEVVMRIDSDSDLSNTTLPGNTLMITGIGGQFDNEAPYLEGYQLFPSYVTDVVAVSSAEEVILKSERAQLFPNPTSERLTIVSDLQIDKMIVFNVLGEKVMQVLNPQSTVEVLALTKGQYFAYLITDEGVIVKEFIKI